MKSATKTTIDYSLYLVTDRALMSSTTLEESVREALEGGVTMVQLREKDCSTWEFYKLAKSIHDITQTYNVPLLINDRVDIALAVDCEGVHLGQSDLPIQQARALLGDDKIIGISASSLAEAVEAEQNGADYLGVGAMFATPTKTDANLVTLEELAVIRDTISLPLVAIGGVNLKTLPILAPTGIDGIAVVSGIVSEKDVKQATLNLKQEWQALKKSTISLETAF
jgi:thiamine-phosphate pyrophosphorylase